MTDRLKGALAQRPKAESIEVIVEIAGADRGEGFICDGELATLARDFQR